MAQSDPNLSALRRRLKSVMAADFPRLRGMLDRWRPEHADSAAALASVAAAIEASAARSERRGARVPGLRIPDELPIAARSEEIIAAIRTHQVVVIAGETGSGKTTQLPKLCLAAGRGRSGLIGCTQPRRIAAKSVARRVAEELSSPLGALVGFAVRFQDQVGEDALVKFMTDGILLAETQSDRSLRRYDTIILDEAHERSLNIDFLLGYLKGLLRRRPDLKLIVTSATIDTERFARHFGGAPVLTVEGRGYPVEVRYRPIEGDREERADTGLYQAICTAVEELAQSDPRGDVLVFLPGEREIRDAHKALEQRRYAHTEVLPLYARLSSAAQDRVFQPGNQRRIVLATNVAETSITVPRIRFVVDTGLARVNRYSQRAKVQRLQVEPISQAAANQRAGRCGRLSAGVCVRLYEQADFERRPRYTDPELLRSSLAGVILRMLDLGLGDPQSFPFIDAPAERAIQDGFLLLRELAAVDAERTITAIGKTMARLPIDVRLARFLVAAQQQPDTAVFEDALVIAAGLSIQDPRERPAEFRGLADAAHRIHAHEHSDFLSLVQLWQAYVHEHEERTQNALREWCRQRYLSYLRMREWRELHRQLLLLARELGWNREQQSVPVLSTDIADPRRVTAHYQALHQALLTAFVTHVARKEERGRYRGPRSRSLQVFPGSGQSKAAPNWIVSASLIETEKLYAMTVARIDPKWIEAAAAHLLKRQCYEPSWDEAGGRAVGFEDLLLYGLPIIQRRRIAYAPVDPPAARALFLRHQLVRGEGPARHPVLAHNARLRAQARAKEEKLRRRGLLRDEEQLAEWFDTRCPAEILDSHGLLRWLKAASPEQRAQLQLELDDLLVPSARGDEREDFPDALDLAVARLLLQYRFDPRGERDGISATLPLAALLALRPQDVDWLVPGLRAEKAALLIKSLPKALRRHVVPAPEFARAFLEASTARAAPFAEALAAFLSRVSGVDIAASDFDPSALPPHLAMHLIVVDANGHALDADRDLLALQQRMAESAQAAFAAQVDQIYHRDGLRDWPLEVIPPEVRAEAGASAWPALTDQGEHAGLRAYASADEARMQHPRGVRRLLLIHLDDTVRYWRRHLKLSGDAQMAYGVLDRVDVLRADMVEAALDRVVGERAQELRTREQFLALAEHARRELGAAAQSLALLVDQILKLVKQLRSALQPPLMGYASANLADAREHLESLVHPGFLHQVPVERLAHYPRYLDGLRLRLERLKRDPARDQARLLELQPFWRRWQELDRIRPEDPAVASLRWAIEELRVSLFAQELKTAEPVSPKRLARMLELLG